MAAVSSLVKRSISARKDVSFFFWAIPLSVAGQTAIAHAAPNPVLQGCGPKREQKRIYLPNNPLRRSFARIEPFFCSSAAAADAFFCASACTCAAFCSATCHACEESTPSARAISELPPCLEV